MAKHPLDDLGQVRAIHTGYHGPATGAAHDRMRDRFVRLVEESTDVVEVRTTDHCVMVFEAEQARAANPRILERYHVGEDRSSNLREG